jgi:hypothetical protein
MGFEFDLRTVPADNQDPKIQHLQAMNNQLCKELIALAEPKTQIWMDIESAPLNGMAILLARIDKEDDTVIFATEGLWELVEYSDIDGRPVYDWSVKSGYMDEPTHWMFLPKVVK